MATSRIYYSNQKIRWGFTSQLILTQIVLWSTLWIKDKFLMNIVIIQREGMVTMNLKVSFSSYFHTSSCLLPTNPHHQLPCALRQVGMYKTKLRSTSFSMIPSHGKICPPNTRTGPFVSFKWREFQILEVFNYQSVLASIRRHDLFGIIKSSSNTCSFVVLNSQEAD